MTEETKKESDLLCWIDCETTGLDKQNDALLEVAVIITDGNLTKQEIGPIVVIHHNPVPEMSEFVREMHTGSGLLKEIADSKLDMSSAELQLLQFVTPFAEPGLVPMAGSTVEFDRAFLEREMPTLNAWFHYRTVNVSSLNEVCRRWQPHVYARKPKKRDIHRAQEDLFDSIANLRFHKSNWVDDHQALY